MNTPDIFVLRLLHRMTLRGSRVNHDGSLFNLILNDIGSNPGIQRPGHLISRILHRIPPHQILQIDTHSLRMSCFSVIRILFFLRNKPNVRFAEADIHSLNAVLHEIVDESEYRMMEGIRAQSRVSTKQHILQHTSTVSGDCSEAQRISLRWKLLALRDL